MCNGLQNQVLRRTKIQRKLLEASKGRVALMSGFGAQSGPSDVELRKIRRKIPREMTEVSFHKYCLILDMYEQGR